MMQSRRAAPRNAYGRERDGICLALLLAAALCGGSWSLAADEVGIRAPAGFEVALYADDDLAHDIYSMTIDSQGRVVVAGAGYIKTLHDDDGDGRADRQTTFSSVPKSGAHGLLCDGDTLYATGDNAILKFVDRDGDGAADGPPERWVQGLSHKEHGANGIERGPDGWIYVICGNDAGVAASFATTPGSPVAKPNCGAILRFSPDGRKSEIVAHGFRNPYDLCFHPQGNIFTVDADGERDHHLPWYAPNRLFDVAPGMHHGWLLNGWQWSWNRPASYFDNVERCAEIGRGSPTGLLCYQHRQFPAKYRGGIFSACWTLGRVYHFPLTPRGSTFDGKVETFLETTGEVGFAPVDMAVGPAGEMFVAIGGRRTRGSVFRVRYVGPVSETRREPKDALERVLDAPQPLAAWSRRIADQQASTLGAGDFQQAALDAALPSPWRVRAIEIHTSRFGALPEKVAEQLLTETDPVAARAAWNLGRCSSATAAGPLLAMASHRPSPVVQRAAWEALASLSTQEDGEEIAQAGIQGNWRSGATADRRIRAARYLARGRGWHPPEERTDDAPPEAFLSDRAADRLLGSAPLDHWWTEHLAGRTIPAEAGAQILSLASLANTPEELLDLMRLVVIAAGDLHVEPGHPTRLAGYSLPLPPPADHEEDTASPGILGLCDAVALQFPADHAEFNREAARFMGMCSEAFGPSFPHERYRPAYWRLTGLLTADSSPVDDIHFLMCLSRISAQPTPAMRANVAAAIARLNGKMKGRGWYPSRNWPDRVAETFAALAAHDPDLPQAVLEHEAFQSPTQAFLFTRLAPPFQAAAARKLMQAVAAGDNTREDDDARWSSDMVTLVAGLPAEEGLSALRAAWDDFALRDAIALHLARTPHLLDQERLLESLASIQPAVVEAAAQAMLQLAIEPTDDQRLALMQALRQACTAPAAKEARQALLKLVEAWSGQEYDISESGGNLLAAYRPVFESFAEEHPELARRASELAGDAAAWQERLDGLDWDRGDADRGKVSFEKRSCVKCHAGSSPLGPDLLGAAGRLSRNDLFAAILEPSKEVAPLYQATQIITGAGKIYHGLVVYESPDGTLLTTGPDTTIRIAGDEIVALRKSRLSIMPSGLLANADDQEVADLYAYLQTLRSKK
jgi:putative membrane-bound dehydrogenase-like protein